MWAAAMRRTPSRSKNGSSARDDAAPVSPRLLVRPSPPRVRATTATAGRAAQASRRQGGGDAIGGAAREVERDDGGGAAARRERCDPADRSLRVVKRPDLDMCHVISTRCERRRRDERRRDVRRRRVRQRVVFRRRGRVEGTIRSLSRSLSEHTHARRGKRFRAVRSSLIGSLNHK